MPYVRHDLVAETARLARSGDAVESLRAAGRRYAAMIRIVTLPITAVVAIAAAESPQMRYACAAASLVLAGWSVFYARQVFRHPPRWVTAVDASALAALALATPWLVSASWLSSGKSWIVPFCTFACVAYQYYEGRISGSLAGLVVIMGMVVGTVTGRPEGSVIDGVITACWAVVVTGLARLLWTLVHRGGELADQTIAEAETARRESRIAALVRADEQASNRDLHDHPATTLLMVGLGLADPRIGEQAERDLAVLRRPADERPPARSDLCGLLAVACDEARLPVTRTGAEQLIVPTNAARAMTNATIEALTNVRRHSGAGSAEVHVAEDGGIVIVEIRDEGHGFDPERVLTTRRGVRESIRGRMAEIGGCAAIESELRRGTTVRLRWTHA
ncbi:sensor histidine kinase [Micromonospora sp. NPDC005252]|uniref:sensor histidine kinase n=1 Tax=unclassified Micromonospora TaxID=2617518 RepID=UPI0036885581